MAARQRLLRLLEHVHESFPVVHQSSVCAAFVKFDQRRGGESECEDKVATSVNSERCSFVVLFFSCFAFYQSDAYLISSAICAKVASARVRNVLMEEK